MLGIQSKLYSNAVSQKVVPLTPPGVEKWLEEVRPHRPMSSPRKIPLQRMSLAERIAARVPGGKHRRDNVCVRRKSPQPEDEVIRKARSTNSETR